MEPVNRWPNNIIMQGSRKVEMDVILLCLASVQSERIRQSGWDTTTPNYQPAPYFPNISIGGHCNTISTTKTATFTTSEMTVSNVDRRVSGAPGQMPEKITVPRVDIAAAINASCRQYAPGKRNPQNPSEDTTKPSVASNQKTAAIAAAVFLEALGNNHERTGIHTLLPPPEAVAARVKNARPWATPCNNRTAVITILIRSGDILENPLSAITLE